MQRARYLDLALAPADLPARAPRFGVRIPPDNPEIGDQGVFLHRFGPGNGPQYFAPLWRPKSGVFFLAFVDSALSIDTRVTQPGHPPNPPRPPLSATPLRRRKSAAAAKRGGSYPDSCVIVIVHPHRARTARSQAQGEACRGPGVHPSVQYVVWKNWQASPAKLEPMFYVP
eukprot:gene14096-biopygen18611